ncbi:MAG: glutamate 5-kinase [Firmicutes bacterium]|nr:glutamate 5-kinase [Alicyclobacillaceae bacterium]MCL6498280.1 glutamate 5-kinase [Bacillota bacterium]
MRVVIKIGTSSLCDPDGQFRDDRVAGLARQLLVLHGLGVDLLVVTSGAVGAGIGRLGRRPETVVEKQALAAVGQALVMQAYQRWMPEAPLAQVLLTRQDLASERRRAKARRTLEQLSAWRVIPVINENDTVADEEIRIGDNDTLAARVAVLMEADLLVLLSDVDGLYTADPRRVPGAQKIETVAWVTAEDVARYGGKGGALGTGGMYTKLMAAIIAQQAGVPMVLADSRETDVILDAVLGRRPVGTRFLARAKGEGQDAGEHVGEG